MVKLIEYLIENHNSNVKENRLFLAALAEVAQHLKAKLVDYRHDYKCTFTPVQSIAMEQMLSQYVLPQVKQIGDFENRMIQLHLSIHQTYEV